MANPIEMETVARLAGLGAESNRFCHYCGAQRHIDHNGKCTWHGGEPDCPHMADLDEESPDYIDRVVSLIKHTGSFSRAMQIIDDDDLPRDEIEMLAKYKW